MLDQNELINWVKSFDVESTVISYCHKCIDNYLVDSPEDVELYFGEYCPDNLLLELKKVYVVINWKEPDYSHIVALVPIVYANKEIGRYELFFKMSGEIYDDLLVIDGKEHLVY
ncbi:hypothetical protein [Paenibacillus ehimensis]|uniref:Uncharacterized protein n=1 Tax=Paenibacillus ehimensis TaxID=79264 RepID=A0ABT8V9G3_9BACL|nr:hypothetical protein [Paenibacillus ehimensis]MDO3676836.1 hypothetical protein [Paenibacillus ehimensis]MEC0210418.1 hypothetical protein [Paenibacillus ehimensis]